MGAKVYSLAHDLKIDFNELLEVARQEDIRVASHMATLTSEQVEHLINVVEKRRLDAQREEEVLKRVEEGERRDAQEKRKMEELAAKAEAAIGTKRVDAPAAPPPTATATATATATTPPPAGWGDKKDKKDAKTEEVKRKDEREKKAREQRIAKEREKDRERKAPAPPPRPVKPESPPGVDKEVEISLPVTVKDLSSALAIKANEIIQRLFKNHGAMVNINQPLPEALIETVGLEFERMIKVKKKEDAAAIVEKQATRSIPRPESQKPRPPVVAFLGHVDHGKTSLLDKIRNTKVAEGEAGGITQHIGAWQVETEKGKITFLDTPGHEAFTEMRSRGARATDIVVLVVDSCDGVMPQTVEALSHARAANTPIIVALNKVDKPASNIDKVKAQLAQEGLQPDDWGGTTPMCPTSAMTGTGVDELLDMIHLVCEMAEVKADPKAPASGVVLEAEMSEGKGIVTTLLVREGTLHKSDVVLCDVAFGRLRAMYDFKGRRIEKAGPSTPVWVSGLDAVPMAGEKFYVFDDVKKAREVAQTRQQRARTETLAAKQTVRLDDIFQRIQAGHKTVNVILKTDVQGSLEVLKKELPALSTAEIKVEVRHAAIGGINESDVLLAETSEAIVVGFNVVPEDRARRLAEQKKVEIRQYSIIYELLDDVRKAMEGLLEPEEKEEILGHLEIREVFSASKLGKIAGCFVTDGTIDRRASVRLIRDSAIIYTGRIASLRRFKDDAKEVREGFECGLRIEGYDDVKSGDRVECFRIVKVARTLS